MYGRLGRWRRRRSKACTRHHRTRRRIRTRLLPEAFEFEFDDEFEFEHLKRTQCADQKRTMFDHEKLDVYQLELAFVGWVAELLVELKNETGIREVRDQLDRASLSSLLNTAEGNGKRQRQLRARFFDDARGSATECAACLDALVAKKACEKERVRPGKEMLVRIAQMVTKMVQLYSTDPSDR